MGDEPLIKVPRSPGGLSLGETQGQEGTFASHGPAWVSRCQEELAEVGTISECKAASHTQELQDRCTRTGVPR